MATNPDCLFCKIVSGAIPVTPLFEDEQTLAFPDINPQAPVHILVIPKQHFASIAKTTAEDSELLGHLLISAAAVAQQQNLSNGYRVVINTGPDGGQTVDHLHLHLLGGRHMTWPPG
jgi:histidine triad (HIT) family protein